MVVTLEIAILTLKRNQNVKAYVHIWYKMVLFIWIDEKRGNGKADEDQGANEGDDPHRHLLGYQRPTDDRKASANEMAKNPSDAHTRHIVYT